MSYTIEKSNYKTLNPYYVESNATSSLTPSDIPVNSTIKPINREDSIYKNMPGIYRFTNLINNKVYVGSACILSNRYKDHIVKGSGSLILKSAIKKYGIENFYYEYLEIVDKTLFNSTKELRTYLHKREQVYLDIYFAQEYLLSNKKDRRFRKLTYNINALAAGGGGEWSDEARENLRIKFRNHGHTCIGREMSEETRDKIRQSHISNNRYKGKNNPNFGVKSTKEKRDKCVKAWEKSGVIYKFYKIDPNLNVLGPFSNVKEYSRDNNLIAKGIQLCLQNKMRVYRGFTYCKENELEQKLQDIKNDTRYWDGNKHQIKKGTCKIIIKDTNTGLIYQYKSLLECANSLDFSSASLDKAVKKNRTKIKHYEILSFEKLTK